MQQENEIITNGMGKKYFDQLRKKTLWEEYTYDAGKIASEQKIILKMKTLDTTIKVKIPSKDNVRYQHIRSFEDYDLSNNLVLEMIIRNEEFQDFVYETQVIDYEFEDNDLELKKSYYKKLQSKVIDKFGFDIKNVESLIALHPYINERITDHMENVANENLILNPPFISDIINGLQLVIKFYLEKNKLYILIPGDYEAIDKSSLKDIDKEKEKLFVNIVNPTNKKPDYILLSVYQENKDKFVLIDDLFYKLTPSQTHLMRGIDDEIIEKYLHLVCIPVTTFGKEKLVSLAQEPFPIEFLDKEFRDSLTGDDFIECNLKDSKHQEILPRLKLPSSKSIEITINQDLPLEEQFEKIRNLHLNDKKTKSFLEVFDKEIEKVDGKAEIKDPKKISKRKDLRNRDYANAFLVYDLYKILEDEFNEKISELEEEAKAAKQKIEKNVHYGKEAKNHEYDKIDEKLKYNKHLFNTGALETEIQEIAGLEISKLRGLSGSFIIPCQSGKIIFTQGMTHENRNRCRAICS